MRTDSPTLSLEAIEEAKNVITKQFGETFFQQRQFKSKSASAQEAHEAIRPTDLSVEVINGSELEQKTYNLIRNRVLASQMSDAKLSNTIITILSEQDIFTAKGVVITFDGFLKISKSPSKDTILPNFKIGDIITPANITAQENI